MRIIKFIVQLKLSLLHCIVDSNRSVVLSDNWMLFILATKFILEVKKCCNESYVLNRSYFKGNNDNYNN